jgi:hypothetical protein
MIWIKRITLLLLLLVLGGLLLIWRSSPDVIRSFLNEQLQPYQLHLPDDAIIRVNPFNLSVNISQLYFTDINHNDFFLEHATINASLSSLPNKKLSFDEITFSGLNLSLAQTPKNI